MVGGEPIGQGRAPSVIAMDQPALPNLQGRLPTKRQLPRTSGQIAATQCHWRYKYSYYISFFTLTLPGHAFVLDGNRAGVRGVRNTFFPFRLQSAVKKPISRLLALRRCSLQFPDEGLIKANDDELRAFHCRKASGHILWFRLQLRMGTFSFTVNVGCWPKPSDPARPLLRRKLGQKPTRRAFR